MTQLEKKEDQLRGEKNEIKKSDQQQPDRRAKNEGMFKIPNHRKRGRRDDRSTCKVAKQKRKLLQIEGLQFLCLLVVIELEAGVAAALEPLKSDVVASADLGFQLLVGCANLADGVIGCQTVLFESLVDVFLLFLKLTDILDGPLEYGALVLVAIWHKAGDLVDAFINGLTTSTFHWRSVSIASSQERVGD
jgi:hypothetical protein